MRTVLILLDWQDWGENLGRDNQHVINKPFLEIRYMNVHTLMLTALIILIMAFIKLVKGTRRTIDIDEEYLEYYSKWR